ncbi:hypothetical protein [Bacillus mesophilum]|uniref:Cadherin-like beta sandwich domain-containing protein n=1 Tax=Bacillus mesophilum TaxID=1071718 RepID=A0A7V7RLE9_9BACI|nr:hypothetical protein [Bacillus mesophilum]KAB2332581.1 hypothetical protein F7732_10830 [Bacillus mesophilum]
MTTVEDVINHLDPLAESTSQTYAAFMLDVNGDRMVHGNTETVGLNGLNGGVYLEVTASNGNKAVYSINVQ